MSRCFQPDVANRFYNGGLSDEELAAALKHAAGCADCRRLLAARPHGGHDARASQSVLAAQGSLGDPAESMDEIQDRLSTWRAARRAPLMPAFPWHKGHQVDRYVIIRSVGGTEDGVVYEAFDPEREDRVVVKQLDLHIEDPATPALMAVAQQLCQLSHPNVLQMLSVGVHAGFVYLVYEFVKGTVLAQANADDPRQLIQLFADAARGLAAAHDAGIVHGSFSAASCVVGRDGRVRVLDFGVGEARVHRAAAIKTQREQEWIPAPANDFVNSEDSFVGFIPHAGPQRRHRTSGQYESIVLAAGPNSLGPRIYAAPELVLGAPPSAASDQFSFCAALYHRLYGHPPADGDTIALWLRELLKGGAPRPPERADVPTAARAGVLRGLEREPSARFSRMSELVARLSRQRSASRTRTAALIAVGGAVAALGLVVGTQVGGAVSSSDCDSSLAGWNSLWTAARQDELAVASGPQVAGSLPALRTRFGGWVGSWRTATHGFCSVPEASSPGDVPVPSRPAEPSDSPHRASRRADTSAECMARAHTAASDLLQLVQASPARLARAAAAAEALPTAAQCASEAPSPASAPIVAVKADIRRRLGMLDEAEQLIAKPLDEPSQRSYQSLVRAYLATDRGDLVDARRLFENATFEAQAAQQPELAVTAAIQRLALSCSATERSLWSGYLGAQTPRGARTTAQTEYTSALAQSLLCEGKIADALALHQQIDRALSGDTGPVGAAAALALARAQIAQREFAAAAVTANRAATIYVQVYGAHHPLARSAQLTVAEAELQSPASLAAATTTIERVLGELDEADRKEPDPVRARALLLQGRIADARGRRADAAAQVQRAAQEYEAALGGANPELAAAQLVAADMLLDAGDHAQAETVYRQVAAIYDTLGQTESARLSHARAGIQLARWGARPPADADAMLHWGLAPTAAAIDPAVAGWLAEQLGRRAAARGERVAALAQYRAAATSWQLSGDPRGLASSVTECALLAAALGENDARELLEQALQLTDHATIADKPRMQGALAKLLWPVQRDRARELMRAALADLPESSGDAAELQQWLKHHEKR